MNLSTRQHQILTLLNEKNYYSIDELSIHFDVATQTIRRDINALCDFGLARRHHGGVGLPPSLGNSSYTNRKVSHAESKQKIAARVVQEIPNGVTIFLGVGTTIATIAEHLNHHKELRVITNNFEAAAILSQYDHIETWLTGGRLRSNDRDILGQCSNEFFSQFIADIGIISCAAINSLKTTNALLDNPSANIMQEWCLEHELKEAQASQVIINNSKETWLVAHSQKWHQEANTKVAMVKSFDRVFKE